MGAEKKALEPKNEKRHIVPQTMTARIMAVVIAGILCAVMAVLVIIISISKNIFIETYGKSQERVFFRIENELNSYHETLVQAFTAMNSDWNLKLYLQDKESLSPKQQSRIAYKAVENLEKIESLGMNHVTLFAVGKNGGTIMNKDDVAIKTADEILSSPEAVAALEDPDSVHYVFKDSGYTASMAHEPVAFAVKALKIAGTDEPYGVVYAMMKEDDFEKYYDYFTSEYASFYMADENDVIVTGSDKSMIGQTASAFMTDSVIKDELPYFNCTAYGVIDYDKALGNLYDTPVLWIICICILGIDAVIIFFVAKRTVRPLSELVTKMSEARNKKYTDYIQLTGSREVEELSSTYNAMLDELNKYINELMESQRAKRRAEIEALQMQINPHYIYNTLASIKWLIFQGDVIKSTKTLDAFIALLRSTIGNRDEYITIEREIENLKNYVLINNTRYGDKVTVEYFVTFGCEQYKIPKMILQPFIENAFFHAFPYEAEGRIEVFIRKLDGNLQIKIADNGVGMSEKELCKLGEKTEHFSGIGINNVDSRLKLLYGDEFGIRIESEKNKGTTVTILVPVYET